ncbi:hypothetical protein V2G26_014574 [Clonostachys chloroleuca]
MQNTNTTGDCPPWMMLHCPIVLAAGLTLDCSPDLVMIQCWPCTWPMSDHMSPLGDRTGSQLFKWIKGQHLLNFRGVPIGSILKRSDLRYNVTT